MQTIWVENVRRILDSLPPEKQQRVEAIVNRHLKACADQGVAPENLERVCIEAVEIAAIDEKIPSEPSAENYHCEPFRRYEQYLPPKDDHF
jgi:hypothetical protein